MRASYDRLSELAHVSNLVSDDTLDPKGAADTLDKRGRWPLVLMVPFAKLDMLRGWGAEIDKATASQIAQHARAGKPFVVASRRAPRLVLFVFAAPDEAAMKRLVDAFAARATSFDVLIPP